MSARLGIDFGTTHTVVAMPDRGNYPVISFEAAPLLPSLIAADAGGDLCFGFEAAAVLNDERWEVLRSFKRLLYDAGLETEVELGGRSWSLLDLLTRYLEHLRRQILRHSNAGLRWNERLEAAVSVPANATSAQRYLTIEAFRRAGFTVLAMLNEPSAAGFEYAHRHGRTLTSRREHVLVYDLGGGTFDASVIRMEGRHNEVVTSEGIARLGGDDFDEVILDLVLGAAGGGPLRRRRWEELLDECRRQKEAVHPNTRRMAFDLAALGGGSTSLPVEEIYRACSPLVEPTLKVLERVLARSAGRSGAALGADDLAGIYAVGGASGFPLVYRALRDRYGTHRVHRSPHPFAATAIGLAIFVDEESGYVLRDRLTRNFGVWREADCGRTVSFDVLFARDSELPSAEGPPVEVARRYRAAHNLGHYRFVECTGLQEGRPEGDLVPWEEIRFPFDAALQHRRDVRSVPVTRLEGPGPEVEERYRCTTEGVIEVTLANLDEGFSRTYRLGRGHRTVPRSRGAS